MCAGIIIFSGGRPPGVERMNNLLMARAAMLERGA